MFDVLLDAILDSLKTLPFLFGAFLLMEAAEKHYGKHMDAILKKSKWGGPLAGSLLGCIPQCGFSVIASNLYAGGLITLGTLLAVYLSTSDEAIILLLADSSRGSDILKLMLTKVIIGILAGYVTDLIFFKQRQGRNMEQICSDCHCEEENGILKTRSSPYHPSLFLASGSDSDPECCHGTDRCRTAFCLASRQYRFPAGPGCPHWSDPQLCGLRDPDPALSERSDQLCLRCCRTLHRSRRRPSGTVQNEQRQERKLKNTQPSLCDRRPCRNDSGAFCLNHLTAEFSRNTKNHLTGYAQINFRAYFLSDGFFYFSQRPDAPQGSTRPVFVTGRPIS